MTSSVVQDVDPVDEIEMPQPEDAAYDGRERPKHRMSLLTFGASAALSHHMHIPVRSIYNQTSATEKSEAQAQTRDTNTSMYSTEPKPSHGDPRTRSDLHLEGLEGLHKP